MRILLATVLCALLPAGTAHAVVVELDTDGRDATLRVSPTPGERNSLELFGTSIGGTFFAEVRDSSAPPVAGAGCELVNPQTVRCATERVGEAVVDVGDRDDAVEELGGFTRSEIRGGSGDDRLTVTGPGSLLGDSGNDRLRGAETPDSLDGGPGNDRLDGLDGNDRLAGGSGDDLLRGGTGSDSLNGAAETPGDRLGPRPGRDRMFGGSGRDYLDDDDGGGRGRTGPDVADGGPHRDIVFSYTGRGSGVRVDLARRGGDGVRGENDSVVAVEDVWGTVHDDVLLGDGSDNELEGREGDDLIRGRGGSDGLRVDAGDRVSGGGGADSIEGLFELTGGSVDCGRGRDVVKPYFSPPREEDVGGWRGPVVDASCEALRSGATVAVDPVPVRRTASGRLTIRLLRFRCCERRLRLTRASRPYRTFDSKPLRSSRVALQLPRSVAREARRSPVTVRAIVDGALVWRFRVRLP